MFLTNNSGSRGSDPHHRQLAPSSPHPTPQDKQRNRRTEFNEQLLEFLRRPIERVLREDEDSVFLRILGAAGGRQQGYDEEKDDGHDVIHLHDLVATQKSSLSPLDGRSPDGAAGHRRRLKPCLKACSCSIGRKIDEVNLYVCVHVRC